MDMIKLDKYKEKCINHKLCSDGQHLWANCSNKKEYMDLALRTESAKWICESISNGWGIEPSYISKKFKRYINGHYVSSQNDTDGEMYCNYVGDITLRSNVLCLINVNAEIDIPNGIGCHVYICGDSNITFKNGKNSRIICYICDDKSKVINNSDILYYERKRY